MKEKKDRKDIVDTGYDCSFQARLRCSAENKKEKAYLLWAILFVDMQSDQEIVKGKRNLKF